MRTSTSSISGLFRSQLAEFRAAGLRGMLDQVEGAFDDVWIAMRTNWRWWAISAFVHFCLVIVLALIFNKLPVVADNNSMALESGFDTALPQLGKIDWEHAEELGDLRLDSLLVTQPVAQEAEFHDDVNKFVPEGGGMKLASLDQGIGMGSTLQPVGRGAFHDGVTGLGGARGEGDNPGQGGKGTGIGGAGLGNRPKRIGDNTQGDIAINAALNWFARHQNANGSWSLDHRYRCKPNGACSGPGSVEADAAATALAMLPFMAAGQTHQADGPYQKNMKAAVAWMMKHQGKDGNLFAGSHQPMYTHGLATIAMCEAYGMTQDKPVGIAAQRAVDFIVKAQHPETGGWRYQPLESGDTSVLGWQVMALKSAQMAGLRVDYAALQGAEKFLDSVATGDSNGLFRYTPGKYETPPMTAVGLLCRQYLGMRPETESMQEGIKYLMANEPALERRDIYYWYYATQVMHNIPNSDWDEWNRKIRHILIDTQDKEGCATGSWDPENPVADAWGSQGGRLMCTSLSTLTLEVHYRYIPLFQPDRLKSK